MKKYINNDYPHFLHGADYNPEQWKNYPGIYDEDMRLFKLANCNELTIGVFSWTFLEPKEDEYDFSLLDEAIERIASSGGKVILATPTGARPRWMAEKYEEVRRVNENGIREHYNSRHNHCYSSEVYREKAQNIDEALAKRYGDNPNVFAWHISNEFNGYCYCKKCQKAFQKYLKNKFKTIDDLNEAYWSSFWSHKYSSFNEIEAPSPISDCILHGLNLDWRRFSTLQAKEFMQVEIVAIKKYSSKPVTTNLIPSLYDYDYREFNKNVDFISLDAYHDWNHNMVQENIAVNTAFNYDLGRSFKHQNFLLMESAPGLVNWKPFNKLKRPGMDTLASIQAIAHGSDSVQYFQFRKGRGGSEKFHGAIVDHEGSENTRIFKAVQTTGEVLKKIDEVCGSNVNAEVAVYFDWNVWWAIDDAQGFSKNKNYHETVESYYKELWRRGISTDIIGSEDDFSKYKLIIFPMTYLLKEETIEKIKDYVKLGGTAFATYMLGMVNENDLTYLGGFPGNDLKEVFGIWNEEINSLYPEENGEVIYKNKKYKTKDYSEVIHTKGAKVLAKYSLDFYKDLPCLTINQYGKGKAIYQAFRNEEDFLMNYFNDLLKELNIKGAVKSLIKKPIKGVSAHLRTDGDNKYLFIENYLNERKIISLDKKCLDMLTNKKVSKVKVNPYGFVILKEIIKLVNE